MDNYNIVLKNLSINFEKRNFVRATLIHFYCSCIGIHSVLERLLCYNSVIISFVVKGDLIWMIKYYIWVYG